MELLSYSELYPNLLRRLKDPFCVLFLYGDMRLLRYLNTNVENILSFTGSRYIDKYERKCIARILGGINIGDNIKVAITGGAIGCDELVINYFNNRRLGNIICMPKITKRIVKLCENLQFFLLIGIYPEKQTLEKKMFLERNKLIAGLSNKLIFLKGGERSGSINTANISIKLGNEILVNSKELRKGGYDGNLMLLNKGLKNIISI